MGWTDKATGEAKKTFHAEARKALKQVADILGLEKSSYEIRSNPGGNAVSGEVILHAEHFYLQVGKSSPSNSMYVRRCEGLQDFTGRDNIQLPLILAEDPVSLANAVQRVLPSAVLGSRAYVDDTVAPFDDPDRWFREGTTVYQIVQDGWRRGEAVMVNRISFHVQPYASATHEEAVRFAERVRTILEASRLEDGVLIPTEEADLEGLGEITMMNDQRSTFFVLRPWEPAPGQPRRRVAGFENVNHLDLRVSAGVDCSIEEAIAHLEFVRSVLDGELAPAPVPEPAPVVEGPRP